MKKKLLKVLSVMLALVLTFSVCSIAYAEDLDTPETEIDIEEYTTIASTVSAITITGITAKCSATVNTQYSTSLKVTVELRKKKSGTYTTIQTWTGSKTGTTLSVGGTKTVNPLSSYRIKVTFKAGSETTTIYTYPK